MLANPYVILVAILAVCGALVGAYGRGRHDGRAMEIAERATQDEVVRAVTEPASNAAAAAISNITVKNVTYRQTLDREIVRVPDYSRCHHSDAGLHAINAALTGDESITAGGGELPTAQPAE